MTGDRLIKEAAKIQPDIPIILCTGHSDRIDEEKAIEMGAAAYTMKPIEQNDFVIMVREVLDKAIRLRTST